MARVYLTSSSNTKIVYTVSQSVGPACSNQRDDVLLVQFFLKVISEGPEKAKYAVPGKGPIKTDGICGPITIAYIKRYQAVNSLENPDAPLTQDGRVDPVAQGSFFGSIKGNLYTILALNVTYRNVRGVAALSDITTDALFPGALRPSLKLA